LGDPEGDWSGRCCQQDAFGADQDRRCTDSCTQSGTNASANTCTDAHTQAIPDTSAVAYAWAVAHTGTGTHTIAYANSDTHPVAHTGLDARVCASTRIFAHIELDADHHVGDINTFHNAGRHGDSASQVEIRFRGFCARWLKLIGEHDEAATGSDEHLHFGYERTAGTIRALGRAGSDPAISTYTASSPIRYPIDRTTAIRTGKRRSANCLARSPSLYACRTDSRLFFRRR
jgi:hypothetical protein